MENSSPKCFISYSWDSDAHQQWVRELATNLQNSGVLTQLDQWDLRPGQNMMEFMEYSIRTSDFVLLICTPKFAERANSKKGGVGYEKSIVTGEIFYSSESSKFIPLLIEAKPVESIPSFLNSKVYIDFRNKSNFDSQFEELLRHIYETPKFPKPELGSKPDFNKPIQIPKFYAPAETGKYLEFNFSNINYRLKLPDWWNQVNIDTKEIDSLNEKELENFVTIKYGKDVGTIETWQMAFKTYAIICQKLNKEPTFLAHCAITGGDHELAIKIFSELYQLTEFLNIESNLGDTYLAYKVGIEYEALGQISLAIYWHKKASATVNNPYSTASFYAKKSFAQLEKLKLLGKQ